MPGDLKSHRTVGDTHTNQTTWRTFDLVHGIQVDVSILRADLQRCRYKAHGCHKRTLSELAAMFMQYSIGSATGRTTVRVAHGNQEKAARRKASREDSAQQTSLSTIAAFAMTTTGAARATCGLLRITQAITASCSAAGHHLSTQCSESPVLHSAKAGAMEKPALF